MDEETEQAKIHAGKADFIKVPNKIRTKVSGGGPITDTMLKNAERILQKHSANNVSRAEEQITSLVKIVRDAGEKVELRQKLFPKIFRQSSRKLWPSQPDDRNKPASVVRNFHAKW